MRRLPCLFIVTNCDKYSVTLDQGRNSFNLSYQDTKMIRKEALIINLKQGCQKDTLFIKSSKVLWQLIIRRKKKKNMSVNIFML